MRYHDLVGRRPRDPVFMGRMNVFEPSSSDVFLAMWNGEEMFADCFAFRAPNSLWADTAAIARDRGLTVSQLFRREAYHEIEVEKSPGTVSWEGLAIEGLFSARALSIFRNGAGGPMTRHAVYVPTIVMGGLQGFRAGVPVSDVIRSILVEIVAHG